MIQLTKALSTWGTPEFKGVIKEEIGKLDADTLLLQQGLRNSSYATTDKLSVIINNVSESEISIRVKVGIFYTGIIPGCNCSDDPTPANEYTEYCELQFDIDKVTAATTVCPLPE
jgi:hypothetical protein